MEKRLAKDRKYYRADMRYGSKEEGLHATSTDTLDSFMASIDLRTIVGIKSQQLQPNLKMLKSRFIAKSGYEQTDVRCLNHKRYVKWAIDKYGIREQREPRSLFEEFTQLVQESQDYLQFYAKKFGKALGGLLNKNSENKRVVLCILRDKESFFKGSATELVNRVLLSLSINPQDDFSEIDWTRFTLLRRMMKEKDFETLGCVNFLLGFFFHGTEEQAERRTFEQIVRMICAKVDRKLARAGQETVSERVLQASDQVGLFTGGVMTKSTLREVLLRGSLIDLSDFLGVIFRQY